MIINVPITVDETVFEGKVSQEIENKIINKISNDIKETLIKLASNYNYYSYSYERKSPDEKAMDGMSGLISRKIGDFIEQNKDEIFKAAGEMIAEKLARTKRAKELLDEVTL